MYELWMHVYFLSNRINGTYIGYKKNLYKMYKYRYRGWDDQGVIWGRERERELEIKSCVGDRIWKWGITQCFFKRMRKYYMKTRVKEMHIGKLDKEFNTYYEKKGRNTCSLNDESLRDIMTRQFQRKLTLCLYIYILVGIPIFVKVAHYISITTPNKYMS